MEQDILYALRNKLRFNAVMGNLTMEDLFDLPLTSDKRSSLNSVAKQIAKQIRDEDSEDFVGTVSNSQKENNIRLNIVKHIISIKQAEYAETLKASSNKAQKDLIISLIEQKKQQELSSKSIEELTAMLPN